MTIARLLEQLSSRGITLEPAGVQLRVVSPPGALTPTLRRELVGRKPELLVILKNRDRWNPLIPAGWTAAAWHGRLLHMAKICMHADRAEELRAWAAVVALEGTEL